MNQLVNYFLPVCQSEGMLQNAEPTSNANQGIICSVPNRWHVTLASKNSLRPDFSSVNFLNIFFSGVNWLSHIKFVRADLVMQQWGYRELILSEATDADSAEPAIWGGLTKRVITYRRSCTFTRMKTTSSTFRTATGYL